MRPGLLVLLAPIAFAASSFVLSAQTQATPSALPAAAQSAYKQGLDFEQRQQLSSALDSFKEAEKLAGNSFLCFEAVERVQMEMNKYKDAAESAAAMASHAPTPPQRSAAEMLEAKALYRQYFAYTAGEGEYNKNPRRATDSLKQAEAVLARGIQDDPANEPLRRLHGRVLAALHEDAQASAEFKACASIPGTDPAECARVLRLSADVETARDESAPPFTLKTLDGHTVTLNSLTGKVVLIDFWATWCPVCRKDSDYVQSLLDSFPGGRFVLLEVDTDEDSQQWKSYLEDNRLEGTETRDETKQVQAAFHVSGLPTYVIVDGNGTMRLRATGIEGDLRGTIRKLLAEQTADASRATSATPAPTRSTPPGN